MGTVSPLRLDTNLSQCDNRSLSLVARRPQWEIYLPKCFLNTIPQPPATLPLMSASPSVINPHSSDVVEHPQITMLALSSSWWPAWQTLDSPRNLFHIFRCYHAVEFPSHDLEEELNLAQLSDIAEPCKGVSSRSMALSTYGPYPNRSSFLLGKWYWNLNGHMSSNDFQDLLKVLNNPDFHVDGLKGTHWNLINRQLGSMELENVRPWLLNQDAGWMEVDHSLPPESS